MTYNPSGSLAPLQFMDLPLDASRPVAWAISTYSRPTGRHYDIHMGLEIGIVMAGCSRRIYGDYSFDGRPGDLWLVGPWEPHGVQILRRQTRHLVLGVLPEFLGVPDAMAATDWMQPFCRPPEQRPRPASKEERDAILSIAGQIQSVLSVETPYRLARLRLLVQELLLWLMERSGPIADGPRQQGYLNQSPNVLSVLRMVEQDPGRKLTLTDAARAARMSRTRFAEEFHSFTGLTFARYLMRRRLRGVVGELHGGEEKLQVIAKRWGFADASHLVRIFRQHVGCTPEVYRHGSQHAADGMTSVSIGTMPRPRLFV